MKCPSCKAHVSEVYGTEKLSAQILRYRRCRTCGQRWRTTEEIQEDYIVAPSRPRRPKDGGPDDAVG